MLARIARARSPLSMTTRAPVARSIATARKGRRRLSKSRAPNARIVYARKSGSIFWPWTKPRGSFSPSSQPSSSGIRKSRSSCLRRQARSLRGGSSSKSEPQSIAWMSFSISSGDMPDA
jgi:hypothetical protein